MGVGGLRWCAVSLAASLALAHTQASAQPAPTQPAPAQPAPAQPSPAQPAPPVAPAPETQPASPAPPSVDPTAVPPAAPPSTPPTPPTPPPPVPPTPSVVTPAPTKGNAPIPTPDAPVGWVMPSDAARRYSPFLNGTLGGMSVGERFDSSAYLGSELGAFFGPWRVALRALFPFGVSQPTGITMTNPDFQSIASTKPALVWGASAGVAVYTSAGFVTSISANFMRSDVSDFGNMLGVSLPLEWVSHRGVRLGFETGFLRAFGGEVLGECRPNDGFDPSGATRECDQGEIRAFDRKAGSGLWLHFLVGIPFDSPDPEPIWSGP